MAIVVMNSGERAMLTVILASLGGGTVYFRLFQNNITPAETDVLADYTEADFSGYSAVAASSWSIPCTVSGVSFATGRSEVFQPNVAVEDVANTIYGYYVTDPSNTVVYWAERFGEAKTMSTISDVINLVPRLELA